MLKPGRASTAKGVFMASACISIEKTTKKSSMRSGMGPEESTEASWTWLWIILVGLHGWWRDEDACGSSRLLTRGAGGQTKLAIVNGGGDGLSAM